MKKNLSLTLALLLALSLFMGGCAAKPAETVSFTLVGDSVHGTDPHAAYETWVDSAEVELARGDTAEDIVAKALSLTGYVTNGDGYISSITTPEGLSLGEGSNGDSCGWMFAVNGVIPSVSMAEYEVQAGDSMVLRFVDDYNTEIDWGTSTFID